MTVPKVALPRTVTMPRSGGPRIRMSCLPGNGSWNFSC